MADLAPAIASLPAARPLREALAGVDGVWLVGVHPDSSRDGPTRLLRLVRYAARLDFAIDQQTSVLARRAIAAGALATVSGSRVGAELRLLLDEPRAGAALGLADQLGLLAA